MNTARLGRNLEWRVRDVLQETGYRVLRAAASQGSMKADLIGIRPGELVLVQCKLDGACPPTERAVLLESASWVGAVPLVAGKGRTWSDPPVLRRLTGPGPKDWEPWTPAADISDIPLCLHPRTSTTGYEAGYRLSCNDCPAVGWSLYGYRVTLAPHPRSLPEQRNVL